MKFNKIIFIVLYVSVFFSSAQSSQESILNNLFNQLEKVNNPKSAVLLEKRIWSIWNEHPTNNNLTERLEFGTELMEYGNYSYALKVFDNIIVTDPKWSEAWNKRATVYFMMGNFDKSMYDIKQTLNLEPRHFGAMDGMGLIFMHMKQYGNALKIYDQMLEIFPNNKSTKDKRKLIKELLLKSA